MVRTHLLSPLAPVHVSLRQGTQGGSVLDAVLIPLVSVRGIVRQHTTLASATGAHGVDCYSVGCPAGPQHSEKPQPVAGTTVLQALVVLVDPTSGSSVPHVWQVTENYE